ncbi:MAG: D-amino-acid transaminase [Thiothrix sp.]|nr:D-amino-acid transaminase [Thiothrix sp.]HPE59940.1 D-amino-acid transaminase [Thiolinea sp.]
MSLANDTRIVYVNGQYLPAADAMVSVFDRGFLFADGVYEVSSVLEGCLIENEAHIARLQRSLNELEMAMPLTVAALVAAQKELVRRNGLEEGALYLQVTRGAVDRDFAYPDDARPTLVMFTQAKKLLESPLAERGMAVISLEDIRWKRRDIKTVGLLAASMAKQAAVKAGADDAWLVEAGFVTEGSSNNAYIVTQDNVIVTRQLSHAILHGITRASVLRLAAEHDLRVEERPFTLEEAYAAREAFITSATTFTLPVVRIDGRVLGDGRPGTLTRQLRKLYIDMALESVRG